MYPIQVLRTGEVSIEPNLNRVSYQIGIERNVCVCISDIVYMEVLCVCELFLADINMRKVSVPSRLIGRRSNEVRG